MKTKQTEYSVNTSSLFFRYTSVRLTPFPVNCNFSEKYCGDETVSTVLVSKVMSLSASPYLSSKWRTKTEQIKILVIVRNLLCPNTLLRLTSSPANCERAKFQDSFLNQANDDPTW